MSWLSEGLHKIGDVLGGGGHSAPDPRKFSNGSTVPTQTNSGFSNMPNGSGAPLGGSSSSLPLASGLPPGLNAQQAAQIQNAVSQNPDLQGVIDTLGGWASDAWSVLSSVVSKAGGWEKIGSDIVGFLSAHKQDILDAANIYEQATRGAQADKYAKEGLQDVKDSFAARQPLRDAGMAGMLNPSAKAPNLSALGAQGQAGAAMQAPTPAPLALAGLNNAAQISSGPGAANPFAKALPLASGPSAAGAPQTQPPAALPIAPHPSTSGPAPWGGTGPINPGYTGPQSYDQASWPAMTPVTYGNGATTTATTNTLKNAKGKFSPSALTPNDATALTPYGPPLPLAGS